VISRLRYIILIAYCLLFTYCCVWIPWQATFGAGQYSVQRVIYSFVWAPPATGIYRATAAPPIALIVLRVISLTALFAAFLAATYLAMRKGSEKPGSHDASDKRRVRADGTSVESGKGS
jgi:hypothetical protein